MKQNERLLVYAVTGFLAVILVLAVVFGPGGREVEGATRPAGTAAQDGALGLGDLLRDGDATPASTPADVLPTPGEVTRQQPLVAVDPAVVAADLLATQLGPSRRDRTVRIVRARAGDSLESLVRRWCGARDPFLAEAKALNEELTVLRVGQEVCVPWIDDADVLAALEAQKPKTMLADGGSDGPGTGTGTTEGALAGITSLESVLGGRGPAGGAEGRDLTQPTFAEPGRTAADPRTEADGGREAARGPATTRAAREYTVKSGDSLWRIADRTYGRQNAARMVREILASNPGLDERLKVGQKIVLPQTP